MSELNKDILYLIFEELQDDSKSLFSCLMVNRLWCETMIPILWSNPWCYDIDYSNKDYLFIIIVSYLSNDIKEFLTRQGIQLPSVSCKFLLFDYLSFCRSINVNTMSAITSIGSPLAYNQFLLQQEFYGLFMKKFSELKYLDMKFIKHQIFYFPEARFRLESLCELRCNTLIDSSYFYGLAQLCQYIQRLIVVNVNSNYHGIAKLIGVQKNLKYFEWKDEHDLYIPGPDSYKEIILALEKNANTIIHLNTYFMFINNPTLQKVLPKLYKLKTLITSSFISFSEEQLKMCAYRNLEVFKMDYFDLKAASIIIENSGGHLKKILLRSSYELDDYINDFNDISLTLIRRIYENCPLVEYLFLILPPSKQHSSEFEKLLKVCQNLKLIILAVYMNEMETEENLLENGEELLKILYRSAPSNLKEIRFLYDFRFTLGAFEEFLEKWKGRPALSILVCDPIYREEIFVKLINMYKYKGIIKGFRCESFINVVKDGL
jgi:hypothetical protein